MGGAAGGLTSAPRATPAAIKENSNTNRITLNLARLLPRSSFGALHGDSTWNAPENSKDSVISYSVRLLRIGCRPVAEERLKSICSIERMDLDPT